MEMELNSVKRLFYYINFVAHSHRFQSAFLSFSSAWLTSSSSLAHMQAVT